jgi:probable phosphoglycerate mutase
MDKGSGSNETQWIFLIRHGETDYNLKGIIQGSGIDSSLNETGLMQAHAFFDHYKKIPFDLVISSALNRTQQTLAPFRELGIPIEQYAELNEINWGIHEGRERDLQMIENYQRVVDKWQSGAYHHKVENGESAFELSVRLKRFIHILSQKTERNILVCSHGRALRCLMCLLRDEELSEMEKHGHANTGLFLIRKKEDKFKVVIENDISHLKASMKG